MSNSARPPATTRGLQGMGHPKWAGFASAQVRADVEAAFTSRRVIPAPPGFVILHRDLDEDGLAWAPAIRHLSVLGWAYKLDGDLAAALTCEGPMVDWLGLQQPDGTVVDLYGGRFASVDEMMEKSELLMGRF